MHLQGLFTFLALGSLWAPGLALPQPQASKARARAPTPKATQAPNQAPPSKNPSNQPPLNATAACTSEPLTQDTWTKLKLNDALTAAAAKVKGTSNTVQELAGTFGAPNFFCGLDSFCNAGQPCTPVELPSWYILVATQNWNSYMNSLNTAITFAASILSLQLPAISNDFITQPRDDVTPLNNILSMFATILGAIPITGDIKAVVSGGSQAIKFISGLTKPPAQPDKFLSWSGIAASLGDVVKTYQASVSAGLSATLNAPIADKAAGLATVLAGGEFLGVRQNVTEGDVSGRVLDALTVYAVGLALTSQRVFLSRVKGLDECEVRQDEAVEMCTGPDADGRFTQNLLLRADGEKAFAATDIAKKMASKYGIQKEQYMLGVAKCFDENGSKQLFNPFADQAIPIDRNTPCLFNLPVCDSFPGRRGGIVEDCRKKGLNL
ncbi:hypothetical protein GGTG_10533 [Gaeumannomyces tritici R3-111a-1]|uniref:DUF7872 domain-containing protein n=1 Tax=Gaeumannomyces tritici (strain R3-111a-1) TaxID=644352 RepID=J3PAK8_GAET3|nr:hypothetical protein GGTG_10533 [Gaeumannomyces tritici R3-111a-1]EJT71274.1 hypothetical protein GGTG_10533 [Gaeumannomyces tritici R3-111a-1]